MENRLLITILVLIVLAFMGFFTYVNKSEVSYVTSEIDGGSYRVVEREDKIDAANRLAEIKKLIFMLEDHLYRNIDKYPKQKQYIEQLHQRIQGVELAENTPESSYTSYSVDKGEEMVICLRSKRVGDIHDLNLLMYVVLHEMAHVACPCEQHNPPFHDIFIFLQEEAIKLGIFKHTEYDINPHEYCGITLRENLLRK